MTSARPDAATAEVAARSLRQINDPGHRLAVRYAENLAAAVPSDHPLRRTGSERVVPALVDSVLRAVDIGSEHPETVETAWRDLGAWLVHQGIPVEAFSPLGHVLVRTVRDLASADGWSTRSSSAWAAYYLWMQRHLASGAATATPPVPPAPPGDVVGPDGPDGPDVDPVRGAAVVARPGASGVYQAWGRGWL